MILVLVGLVAGLVLLVSIALVRGQIEVRQIQRYQEWQLNATNRTASDQVKVAERLAQQQIAAEARRIDDLMFAALFERKAN